MYNHQWEQSEEKHFNSTILAGTLKFDAASEIASIDG
jgi:hypothetical protein